MFELNDIASNEVPPHDPLELPTGTDAPPRIMVTHPPLPRPQTSQLSQKQVAWKESGGFVDQFAGVSVIPAPVTSAAISSSQKEHVSADNTPVTAAPSRPSDLQSGSSSPRSSPAPPPRSVVLPPPPFSPPPDSSLSDSTFVAVTSPNCSHHRQSVQSCSGAFSASSAAAPARICRAWRSHGHRSR